MLPLLIFIGLVFFFVIKIRGTDMGMLLLLIFIGLVFFFVIKFTVAVTAVVAIIVGTTTVTTLICVWFGTSYYLRVSGYKPDKAEKTYQKVDSDLEQIVGDLQEIRFELEEVEPYLRDVEFLRYARQNPKAEN
ncbi:MAG: hypothetical protein OXN25_23420 [Candidatus Poribacteria bacterium]|nr:hypothetical protein [Candidatus Poribacteria bacterium]